MPRGSLEMLFLAALMAHPEREIGVATAELASSLGWKDRFGDGAARALARGIAEKLDEKEELVSYKERGQWWVHL